MSLDQLAIESAAELPPGWQARVMRPRTVGTAHLFDAINTIADSSSGKKRGLVRFERRLQ